ncbi:MAG: ABC transporter substrate-binding protein [Ktedonobacteraceae bacterium]
MKRSSLIRSAAAVLLGVIVLIGGLFLFQVHLAHAQTSSTTCTGIQYGAFTRSVAFIEAQQRGYFAQAGLNVCYNQVSSSTQQFDSLLSGQYDIVSTTADNVVNRYVNSSLPVQIVDGIDQGAGLDLIANTANGIHSIADLKGKSVAVDAPNSGYVFALEKILAANGLSLANNDYSLQVIGGSLQRFNAISAGQTSTGDPVYATILGTPFSEQAHYVSTLTDLGQFSSYVAPYQGSSLATTQSYAQAHSNTVTAFIKATIQGRFFAANPANQSTVIADIASTFSVPTQTATDIYNDSQNFINGENLAETLNPLGLINTINLRKEFGGFTKTVNALPLIIPGKTALYDDEYWKAALFSL